MTLKVRSGPSLPYLTRAPQPDTGLRLNSDLDLRYEEDLFVGAGRISEWYFGGVGTVAIAGEVGAVTRGGEVDGATRSTDSTGSAGVREFVAPLEPVGGLEPLGVLEPAVAWGAAVDAAGAPGAVEAAGSSGFPFPRPLVPPVLRLGVEAPVSAEAMLAKGVVEV